MVSTEIKCKIVDCNNLSHSKGMCSKHYRQVRIYGKTFKSNAEFNEIIDKGKYYELILTNMKMEEVGRAKIDKDDLDKIKSIGRWSLHKDGYVFNKKNKYISMHRLVMDAKESEDVDHIKTGIISKSDNRKNNLRVCTKQQNTCNKPSSRNTSGYKGVSLDKRSGKWLAQIRSNNKNTYLSIHDTPEKAHAAYVKAAKILHGEFANYEI